MTLSADELKDRFRSEVDDLEGGAQEDDYLWSDDEIYEYMDLAQRKFVRKTEILRKTYPFNQTDDDGVELTALTFTASGATGFLDLHPKVIRVLSARMQNSSHSEPLDIVDFQRLNAGFYDDDYGWLFTRDWQARTGPARYIITNMQEDMVRLVPIPTEDDVVELMVKHMPLYRVECGSTLEVTEMEDQLIMLHYMKHRAFLKQDADVYDKELSREFLAYFNAETDERRREIGRLRTRVRQTMYGGIPF